MAREKNTVKTAQNAKEAVSTNTAVKKKRSWVPNPQKDFGQENVEPGDNSRFLRLALVAWDLPPIDISDPKQVEERINKYFEFCIQNDVKPQKIEMSRWLGINKDTMYMWQNGETRSATHTAVIKKADALIHSLWVDYMLNGKINPASGIFLGKNMFGYRDVIDIAPTTSPPLGEQLDEKALTERLDALPDATD